MMEEYNLRADGAGPGEFRGGSGVIRTYRALTDNQFLIGSFERHKTQSWGSQDGGDGSTNQIEIIRENGKKEGPFGKCSTILNKNDVVRLTTATGGGLGNPLRRPVDKVLQDVKNEFVTVEQAEKDYGDCIHPKTLEFKHYTPDRLNYIGM